MSRKDTRDKYIAHLYEKFSEIFRDIDMKEIQKAMNKVEDFPGQYLESNTKSARSLTEGDCEVFYSLSSEGMHHLENILKILSDLKDENYWKNL